jgi:hypothetical protein
MVQSIKNSTTWLSCLGTYKAFPTSLGSFVSCPTSGPKGLCQKCCRWHLEKFDSFIKGLTRVNSRGWLGRFIEPVSSRPPNPHPILEEPNFYSTGGFPPVSLGETFNSGAYKATRELGHGQYSTVWLARDLQWVDFSTLIKLATYRVLKGSEVCGPQNTKIRLLRWLARLRARDSLEIIQDFDEKQPWRPTLRITPSGSIWTWRAKWTTRVLCVRRVGPSLGFSNRKVQIWEIASQGSQNSSATASARVGFPS